MGGIRLSKDHGLNPSVDVCFWCGEGKAVLLLGAAYKGEAPRQMVTTYVPCDDCQSKWEQAVILIEVAKSEPGNKQLRIDEERDLIPTGRMWGITEEAAHRWFDNSDLKLGSKFYIDPQIGNMIQKGMEAPQDDNE